MSTDLVRVAAGCGGTGAELLRFTDLTGRWFTTRTITLDPHAGAAAPRIVEAASGLVHCTGEPNPGLEAFAGTELPVLVRAGARVLVSVAGRASADLLQLARRLGAAPGIAGVEVHLAPDSDDLLRTPGPAAAADLISQVRAVLPGGLAVHAKLGPEHSLGHARVLAGLVDALVVSGAVPAALPDGRSGSLVGPAVLPVTAARVAQVRAAVPQALLIAAGGVRCGADVQALLRAGASAVQVGSGLLHDPTVLDQIDHELQGAPR